VKKLWQYVKLFSSNTGTWQRTDGRTDRIAISISWVSILTRDKNYNTETVLLIFLFLQTNITSQMWPSGVGGPEVRGGSSLGRRHSPPLTNAQASKFLDLLDDNGYERWYLISVLINTNAGGKGLPPPLLKVSVLNHHVWDATTKTSRQWRRQDVEARRAVHEIRQKSHKFLH